MIRSGPPRRIYAPVLACAFAALASCSLPNGVPGGAEGGSLDGVDTAGAAVSDTAVPGDTAVLGDAAAIDAHHDDDALDALSTPAPPEIAFTSNRSGSYGVYVARLDGSGVKAIISDAYANLFPAWSPDAQRIAFSSNRTGVYAIYLYDLATGSTTPVVTSLKHATSPSFSPDGKSITFEGRTAEDAPADVYVRELAGSAPERRLTEGTSNNVGPTWASDGRIFFVSSRGGAFDVYQMPAAGGAAPTQITSGAKVLGRVAVSPDLSKIAFAKLVDGQSVIVLRDLASAAETTFTAQNDSEPAFSPTGKRLAWTSLRFGNPAVMTGDVTAGAAAVRLTYSKAVDGSAAFAPISSSGK